MPNSIMDRFFKMFKQKVNLGRQGRQEHNEESESCPSCMWHTDWSSDTPTGPPFYPNMKVINWRIKITYRSEKD